MAERASAPFCSEYDDYQSERNEVLRDQGNALPFPYGMYVIGELVGALCPDDLDAMDESIPFSKATFDNLLGVIHSEPEYRAYFDGFCVAQSQRRGGPTQTELQLDSGVQAVASLPTRAQHATGT